MIGSRLECGRLEWNLLLRSCSVIGAVWACTILALQPVEAQVLAPAALSSERIAAAAFSVAQSTRTTGRCYAAVSRALHPLGVELSGAAAYQAQDILLRDSRFIPLSVNGVEQLRRGDIVVYTRSSTHPYGHICVYEGNYEEASDHLASITHTKAYGGATVFRLREDQFGDQVPSVLSYSARSAYSGGPAYAGSGAYSGGPAYAASGAYSGRTANSSSRGYASNSAYLSGADPYSGESNYRRAALPASAYSGSSMAADPHPIQHALVRRFARFFRNLTD